MNLNGKYRLARVAVGAAIVSHVIQVVVLVRRSGAVSTTSRSALTPLSIAVGVVLSACILAGVWGVGWLATERKKSWSRGLLVLVPVIGLLIAVEALVLGGPSRPKPPDDTA